VNVLVDSSLWVHQLRRGGDPAGRQRVEALLAAGTACWCPVVRLELWRGVTSDAERQALRRYDALLRSYEITPPVWERAIALADRGRAAGVTLPLADLVIFTCARVHGLELAHDDGHFDTLTELDSAR
jgi:predicted nucleic acid-binding protein